MLTGSELGAAIEAARIKKNVPKNALAKVFGISAPSVNGWVSTGRIDKSKLIEVIRYFSDVVGPDHWGLSPDDAALLHIAPSPKAPTSQAESAADAVLKMLARHGKSLSREARQQIVSAAQESPQSPGASNVITADFSRPGPVGDEIRIAHYDVRAAMGDGQMVPDYPEIMQDIVVSQKHLAELGVSYKDAAHLKMLTGWGQSMAPTIQDLDPMIADASIREFQGDGIYAFSWQGHFYVKRLQVIDAEHFDMISDNPNHKDREIRIDETYIQARILLVWNARKV
ncbi:S24 family peptidase [Pseudomonas sp. B392_1p]|uniref:S24 family peptidase n=1 Tax=Pseudomonas sp. B392_1p TaxID=3457507 RepID=UPI003FD093FC